MEKLLRSQERLETLGAVWFSLEATDTKEMARVRKQRDKSRERKFSGANYASLGQCAQAVAKVRELSEFGATNAVASAADEAAAKIYQAVRTHPDGVFDLIDILVTLADTLTERQETHFSSPQVFTLLASLWGQVGEIAAAKQLITVTIQVLDVAIAEQERNRAEVAGQVALAYCGFANLLLSEDERDQRLITMKFAWERVQLADPAYRHVVIAQYLNVLQEQQHVDAIPAGIALREQLSAEAGSYSGWFFEAISAIPIRA